jgi:RecA/RadA recombinase
MPPLLKRRVGNAAAASVEAGIKNPAESKVERSGANVPTNFEKTVSTGSTLLDLAISGGRLEEGGIPGGIIVEIFGPNGAGKTALLSELATSAQSHGGTVKFLDPEARLDLEYSKIYGMNVNELFEYARPNTVSELFTEHIWNWNPPNTGNVNMVAADSLAALSTNLEMDKDEGDKMGMRRAKEFSEGLRKTCRLIAEKNHLIVCSNQIRMGEGGKVATPGGMGIPFYASLRIQIKPAYPVWQIKKKRKIGGADVEKVLGVISECTIIKSSLDDPWRKCPLSVVFGYGIDTIRDELMYFKKLTAAKKYNCFGAEFVPIEDACAYIEEHDLHGKLKNRTIELWNDVQRKMEVVRKPKKRG